MGHPHYKCPKTNTGGSVGVVGPAIINSDWTGGQSVVAGALVTRHIHFFTDQGLGPNSISSFSISSSPASSIGSATWAVPGAEPGAIDLSFTAPSTPDNYTITMQVNGYTLPGISLDVLASPTISASNSYVDLPATETFEDVPFYFNILFRDSNNMPVDLPAASVVSFSGIGAGGDITGSLIRRGLGSYRQLITPSTSGNKTISVTLDGQALPSPPTLTVKAAAPISISGVTGVGDSTVDGILSGSSPTSATIHFADVAGETGYWVYIYKTDNGDLVCGTTFGADITPATLTGCPFAASSSYYVVVTAFNGGGSTHQSALTFTTTP